MGRGPIAAKGDVSTPLYPLGGGPNAWLFNVLDDASCYISSGIILNKSFVFGKANNVDIDGNGTYNAASIRCAASDTIQFNVWQHLVGTWDGTKTITGTHLYKNGLEISYGDGLASADPILSDASYSVRIGRGAVVGVGAFDGHMREVQVYDRVLTPAEIQDLYGLGIIPSGLVGRWQLGEGAGTTANDTSGNGNTGTLQNGPTWIGLIDSGEDCDGSNLDGATCQSLGALGGTLSCTPAPSGCTYDVTQCVFPPPAACEDGIDNDGDNLEPGGGIDFVGVKPDPGCSSSADNDERNQCLDLKDNDGDGLVDTADPGCHLDGNPANAPSYSSQGNLESNQIFQEI